MALPDYEIQLSTRPLGGEVQRQVDVAIRLANTFRIASRWSRRRSNVWLLYVLVALRVLRPVRDNPSALVFPIGNRRAPR